MRTAAYAEAGDAALLKALGALDAAMNNYSLILMLEFGGVRMLLPQAMDVISYFGYGPYESYVDKHRASVKHMYVSTVASQHEDYIRPQENGSHWNCDYLRLSGPLGGFEVIGDEFSFNVSRYTQEELERKAHSYELEQAPGTVFCLDDRQTGIGSNSCGPELSYRYAMPAKFCFKFSIVPLTFD